MLDLPDRDRIEGRRADGFPGPQIEAGMVPGTADALAIHQAFGERTMIMAAARFDRENFRSRTHQQHVFVADMAKQGRSREFGRRDTLRQIGTGGWGLLVSHGILRSD